ncbi:MAG: hypothetical protein ACQERL_11280 [Bacillota bacterium]
MKKLIILILIYLIFFFAVQIVFSQGFEESNPEIETSIVLLTLFDINKEMVYEKNDFFELFYFKEEDYVLLPANLIVPYLDVELNFNRELSILILTKANKEVIIDLKDKKYIDHPEWDTEEPIIYGGEFYLSKKVFSYLTNYKISWNNSFQELHVEGEFIEDLSQDQILDLDEKKDLYQKEKEEILGDELRGFQLSSVHYRVELELEDRIFSELSKNIRGDLNFYGRVNNWAYFINNNLSYNLNNQDVEYELDKIKFKYQENNMLIIAGDHDLNLKNTMGKIDMQGLYFSLPDRLSFKLIPYTTLKINVKKGDDLSIIINNKLAKKEAIKRDREFLIENLELRAGYLNKIEIIIIDKDGNKSIKTKYLAGSSNILQPKVKEIELMAGRFRDSNFSDNEWEGYFGSIRSNYALNDKLSFNLESTIYNESENPDSESENEILSSITGFALRLGGSTVINLDWLVAGEFDNLENGAQAELLFSMLKGYIKGVYIYFPPEIEEYMEEDEGEDKSISMKLDLTNNWSINPTIGQRNTLENRLDESDYYRFRVIYNPNWRNYNSVSLLYEDNREDYLISDIENNLYLFEGNEIKKGVALVNNLYGNTFRITSELAYYDNDLEIYNFPPDNYQGNYQDYEAELSVYKRINNYLFISLNYDGEQQRDSLGLRYYDRIYDGQIRLSFSDRASLTLSTERREEESENLISEESSLKLKYYFNREFSVSAELNDYQGEFLSDYQSLLLSGDYYFPDNPGYIRLFGEYIVPEDGQNGISFGGAYDIIRDDESGIVIEAGREYQNFLNGEYEEYVTISYSHALSFIGSEKKNTRFTDFEPRPIVAGYVYLDQNYNGVMDPGEKKLKDISMRLDSIMTETDEDGFFIFKPYFNDLYLLNFDYRNLIADYTPVTKEILVRVKDNQNIMQNFGLTINGSISGKVYLDKNANGNKDENEEYLVWAGLSVGNLNKKDYTDQRGEFYFENVPLGYHKLNLLKESLPRGTKPLNGYEHDVYITEDRLDHHDIDIPIIYGD